ncbi:MAG: helix-turn-helix domain-containing protein [Coriobacteriales bacterium]|nr:helix-turn-helix domain-containing protein [Coriobacteriales bacterium]
MDRLAFISLCDARVKLVRTEYGFTQEKMAAVLGISKKTLVEIEKGRKSLGWTTCVALCSIFGESDILSDAFGGKATDVVLALSFEGEQPHYTKTLGGKVWWLDVEKNEVFIIQQNIISQHYRLLTKDHRRVASSFKLEDLLPLFNSEQGS